MTTLPTPPSLTCLLYLDPGRFELTYKSICKQTNDVASGFTRFVSLQIPETMWRVAKDQNPDLIVAVVESWDWIHNLVEKDVVDFEFVGNENDTASADAISLL